MKRHLLIVLISVALLTGCGNGDNPGHGKDTVSYTIDFSKIDLEGASQIFDKQSLFKDKILEAANKDLSEPFLLDVSTTGNNSVKIEKSDFISGYTNVQGLIVGTSSNDGELYLTFSKECLSVTIKAEQYYNIFTGYSSGSPAPEIRYDGQRYVEVPDGEDYYEGYFEIGVNSQTFEGPGKTYVYDDNWNLIIDIPESKTETFDIGSKELTISGYESVRTRIYEMTFEFEA